MHRLADALALYGDAPVVVSEDGAATAAELWRRADALISAAGAAPILRVASDSAADVIAALLAGGRARRTVLLSTTADRPVDVGACDVLLATSGTAGRPKIAAHDLASLAGRIRSADTGGVWLLTYAATAFAGLQVILTALLTRALVVAPISRAVVDRFHAAVSHHVTHASGTPTFWRAWLLTSVGAAPQPPLEQITIGGEAVDQTTLDRLATRYPSARITHIYASTEAGALFAVNDRRAGFPAAWLDTGIDGTQLRVVDGILDVRSPRAMRGYRSADATPMTADGWLRTGDLVEPHGDRIVFCGRSDRIANVGGYKVAPERVERVLLEVEGVADAYVYPRANAITGNVLVAELVCDRRLDAAAVVAAVEAHAARTLAKQERPVRISVVDALQTADSGKKARA
jgi:acyl-CoA synthetase (AMP-forming)/AMP-acid ligase II